jgi:hypothetical protein
VKFKTIKIPEPAYDLLVEVAKSVARRGWVSVGSKRADGISLGAIVDEALSQLGARIKRRSG